MQRLQQLRARTRPPLTHTQRSNGLGPFLSKLPTELRFMVLGNCIASGHPEFMRASQALHQDGRALIFEKGTYRMWFGPGLEDNGEEPSPYAFGRIRKFDITLDLRIRNEPLDDALLGLYLLELSRGEGRKCVMRFRTGCGLKVASDFKTLELMEYFRGFEEVVLRVEIDKSFEKVDRTSAGPVMACEFDMWEREGVIFYIVVWYFLEPGLGKAEVVRVEGGLCLVYRPGKKTEVSEGLEG